MPRTIKYYNEDDIQPCTALTWNQIRGFLWIGYNPRFAGSKKRAEDCINKGVDGDVLAVFESFAHLIWKLMQAEKIVVTDNKPLANPPAFKEVHKNLFICLTTYSKHLHESFSQRLEAWKLVEDCLAANEFNSDDNQQAICQGVYDALFSFFSTAGWGNNAMVIAKVHSMKYNDEVGGFCKKGKEWIPAEQFSPQIWSVNFEEGDVTDKRRRAVWAMFKLALGEIPSKAPSPPSQFEMSYFLYKGAMVTLRKPVETGGMVAFQSSSWDWRTDQQGDNTSLNLLNSNGDYLLHISLRQGQNVIILNSRYADGEWGQEEQLQLRDSFMAPNFSISVIDNGGRFELLFSYQRVTSYNKRIVGVVSSVSYRVNDNQTYSPLSDSLVVSTFDAVEQLALSNRIACSEIEPPLLYRGNSNTNTITTKATFARCAKLAAAPGQKKKDRLGFEYAEHCYFGDTITLTLSDGSKVLGKDHTFTLENGLNVTYGEINGLAGDFYGTYDPISDGNNESEQVNRFLKAYNTLAGLSPGQPAEAIEILGILQNEVNAVNDALHRHQDPSVAYSTLPDQSLRFEAITWWRSGIPGYIGLAQINWDHFGADARTAYNAGHSKALDEAVAGDLEKAYALNAFADHFLEDSFSAGHLRTPRRDLHSSWNPAADYCAKLMHDEDNAIGLSVKNLAGETWTAYGDKRGLDEENNDNMVRCLKALQVSADEIYSAWKSKTAPSKSNYGAWTQAPTLESAKGLQILAPLFIDKNNRRSTITNRRNWSFTTNWSFFKTALDCVNSGWWKYPITIDGPKGVLNGSAVAATATSSWKCNVYFQDSQGGIREDVNSGGWKATNSSIFEAKKFSPLAVISFDSGDEIRVYCVSEDGYLQEWCYSSGQSGWRSGYLTDSKFRVAANTKLAAVYWDDGGSNIRVYCQEPYSDEIQEYCNGNPWTRGSTLPTAHTGSSIAAVGWLQDGIHLRVYYQAPDMTLREQCWDGSWNEGSFQTDKMPRHASIAATAWYASSPQIRVYCQDARRNISAYKHDGGWSYDGIVVGPLQAGVLSSVIQWNSGNNLRLYYQSDCDDIREECQDSDESWVTGSFVGTDG